MKKYSIIIGLLTLTALIFTGVSLAGSADSSTTAASARSQIRYNTIMVQDVEIFYREAGSRKAPTILLLLGFPTSSHMFRNLIPSLADRFHLLAPDYPGFGNSSAPATEAFEYTFDHLADVIDDFLEKLDVRRYSLYVMDYGASIGFRLAVRHPDRVKSLIIQNGNAYVEGLGKFWDPIRKYWDARTPENAQPLTGFISPEGVEWQYTHGVRNKSSISPDNWNVDECLNKQLNRL